LCFDEFLFWNVYQPTESVYRWNCIHSLLYFRTETTGAAIWCHWKQNQQTQHNWTWWRRRMAQTADKSNVFGDGPWTVRVYDAIPLASSYHREWKRGAEQLVLSHPTESYVARVFPPSPVTPELETLNVKLFISMTYLRAPSIVGPTGRTADIHKDYSDASRWGVKFVNPSYSRRRPQPWIARAEEGLKLDLYTRDAVKKNLSIMMKIANSQKSSNIPLRYFARLFSKLVWNNLQILFEKNSVYLNRNGKNYIIFKSPACDAEYLYTATKIIINQK